MVRGWLTEKPKLSIKLKAVNLSIYKKELANTGGFVEWTLCNNKGKKLASGVYIYLITNNQNQKATGKIGIIK